MELTQQYLQELFDYDALTGILYHKKIKRGTYAGSSAGFMSTNGYMATTIKGRKYRVHRLIFLWCHGYLPEEVDHINCIRTDNRILNLRAASSSQNSLNRSVPSNNKTGIKGLSWDEDRNQYRAVVWLNKQRVFDKRYTKNQLELAKKELNDVRNLWHKSYANNG